MRVINYRVNTPVKKPKSKYLKVFLALLVIAVAGFLYTRLSPTNKPNDVAGDVSVLAATSDEGSSGLQSHPLSNIVLPEGQQSAIGTVERGVVKTNESGNPMPMASIAKIVTALVILEKSPISQGQKGDIITLEAKDEEYYHKYISMGGAVTPVTAGESMTQYEVLQTMLLPSANNMADTLVDHYFGSVDKYISVANEYLARNGLHNTKVVDATGFSPGSVSTPSDLIKLGQLALLNPTISEIVAQVESTVAVAGQIKNYNIVIEEPNVTGIKPGFTDEAGSCLLYSAQFTDRSGKKQTVIMAVMGVQDRGVFADSVLSLLNQSRYIYQNQTNP